MRSRSRKSSTLKSDGPRSRLAEVSYGLHKLLPWAIFGVISFGVWALINAFSSRSSRALERLEELRDPTLRNREGRNHGKTGMGAVVEMAAPALSKALQPKTDSNKANLKMRLANAGYNSPTAPQVFPRHQVRHDDRRARAGRRLRTRFLGLDARKAGPRSSSEPAWASICPRPTSGGHQRPGKNEFFCNCPTLSTSWSSAWKPARLRRGHASRLRRTVRFGPGADLRIRMANKQLQMGRPRREVLHDLGVRTGVDDMRALAAILIQADKFGSSIAQALRVQSDSMRVKRRQIAEERAQQTAVKMIFPLVLFIFPGIFVVLVGPAAISMINGLLKTN